ncbi:MAG: hypothetical protein WBN37_08395 [Arenicellales bacterium]
MFAFIIKYSDPLITLIKGRPDPINLNDKVSGSFIIPPGMIDGGDVGAPGWRNDGYGQCFEIGEGCKCKGDAQGPERPVGEQANGPDHDEKPSDLGGTRVYSLASVGTSRNPLRWKSGRWQGAE